MSSGNNQEIMRARKIIAGRAQFRVKQAIKRGQLVDLSLVDTKCTDCAERATCYDHRLYSKPLDVQPVCRSCNVRRGPALDIAAELLVRGPAWHAARCARYNKQVNPR